MLCMSTENKRKSNQNVSSKWSTKIQNKSSLAASKRLQNCETDELNWVFSSFGKHGGFSKFVDSSDIKLF